MGPRSGCAIYEKIDISMTIKSLQKELRQCRQDRQREHDLYCKLAEELKNITEVLAEIKDCIRYFPRYLPERKVEGRPREKATLEILILAAPIMEAWAKSHELAEWHCRVESLIGTAYPAFYNHPILPEMNDNQ